MRDIIFLEKICRKVKSGLSMVISYISQKNKGLWNGVKILIIGKNLRYTTQGNSIYNYFGITVENCVKRHVFHHFKIRKKIIFT